MGHGEKLPVEYKGLLVRVTQPGRMGKPVWASARKSRWLGAFCISGFCHLKTRLSIMKKFILGFVIALLVCVSTQVFANNDVGKNPFNTIWQAVAFLQEQIGNIELNFESLKQTRETGLALTAYDAVNQELGKLMGVNLNQVGRSNYFVYIPQVNAFLQIIQQTNYPEVGSENYVNYSVGFGKIQLFYDNPNCEVSIDGGIAYTRVDHARGDQVYIGPNNQGYILNMNSAPQRSTAYIYLGDECKYSGEDNLTDLVEMSVFELPFNLPIQAPLQFR